MVEKKEQTTIQVIELPVEILLSSYKSPFQIIPGNALSSHESLVKPGF